MKNGVVLDLSQHPTPQYAVIFERQLLPVRFASEIQAVVHLDKMVDETRARRRAQETADAA